MNVKTDLVQTSGAALASVEQHRGFVAVSLPPEFAAAAVARFLSYFYLECLVFDTDDEEMQEVFPLEEGEWCVAVRTWRRDNLDPLFPQSALSSAPYLDIDGYPTICMAFPRHTIHVLDAYANRVKRALEKVKEELLRDESGMPLTWVPVQTPTAALHGHEAVSEPERRCVEGPEELDSLPPEPEESTTALLPRDDIVREFERIREFLKLPEFPLTLYRGSTNKNGYVTGRVFADFRGHPLRMVLTTCPNADLAEATATLVHEFAHLVADAASGHGTSFKEALVKLASDIYGRDYFAAPLQRLRESYHVLDMWIATGIRAALRQGEPPVAKDFDEQLTASVVSRIQKMRALAADKPGTAEAITATAIANTQVTLYELGDYRIRLDAKIDEQMVDRWLNIGKNIRWKRDLAFHVAEFCNVFSLARPDKGWMHFFGKYRDIVAAEYLYGVCLSHIERQCERHIQAWKERQLRVSGGKTRSEKISFCTSAVRGISDKMDAIRELERKSAWDNPDDAEAQAFRLTSNDLQEAEQFAASEHSKRGTGWSSDSSSTYRYNESGYEAGQSVQLNSGVGAGNRVRGLLK